MLADAVDDIDGSLVGGTALTIHLQHRTSFDLDFMTHESFSGTELFAALRGTATHAVLARAEPNRTHAVIDGVAVEVFAAPTRGEHPGHVHQLQPPSVVAGMRVASLADLLAMKLDVIMYRPKLRDYIDLAAIDNSGLLRLEDGMHLHMKRYGTDPQSSFLDRIIDTLEDPGYLAADRVFASHAPRVLGHLAGRVPELRTHIKRLRKDLHTQTPPPPRQAGFVASMKPPPTAPADTCRRHTPQRRRCARPGPVCGGCFRCCVISHRAPRRGHQPSSCGGAAAAARCW